MLGPGLALRGPDGSMHRAVDGLMLEYRLTFLFFTMGAHAWRARRMHGGMGGAGGAGTRAPWAPRCSARWLGRSVGITRHAGAASAASFAPLGLSTLLLK